MGNNPTRSQKLQNLFLGYRFMPDLTCHSSNTLQFIFVENNGQIYMIKQLPVSMCGITTSSTKNCADSHPLEDQFLNLCSTYKNESLIPILDCKICDQNIYMLYKWIPTTISSFYRANQMRQNKDYLQTKIVAQCIEAYRHFFLKYKKIWPDEKFTFNLSLECVRVIQKTPNNFNFDIKIIPPEAMIFSKKDDKKPTQFLKNLINLLLGLFFPNHISPFLYNQNNLFIFLKQLQTLSDSPQNWDEAVRRVKIFEQQLARKYSYTKTTSHNNSHPEIFTRHQYPSPIKNKEYIEPVKQFEKSPKHVIKNRPQDNLIGMPIVHHYQHNNTSSGQNNQPKFQYKQTGNINGTQMHNKVIQGRKSQNSKLSPFIQVSKIYETQTFSKISDIHKEPSVQEHSNYRPAQNYQTHAIVRDNSFSKSVEKKYHSPKNNNNNQTQHIRQYSANQLSPVNGRISENKINTNQMKIKKQLKVYPLNAKTDYENLYHSPSTKTENFEYKQLELETFRMFQRLPRSHMQPNFMVGVPQTNYICKTKMDLHEISHGLGSTNEVEENKISKVAIKNPEKKQISFSSNDFEYESCQREKAQKFPNQIFESKIPNADDTSSLKLIFSDDSYEDELHGNYTGQYHPSLHNMKHGYGCLTFFSGGSYQGDFSYNKMQGYGKLFYPSGRLAYEGYWQKNKFHGYGKLFNEFPEYIEKFNYRNFNEIQLLQNENSQEEKNGYWKMFEGNMKNDMKEGHGIWILQNGEKFQGEFREDYVDGQGIFYGKDGVIEGIWSRNILTKINEIRKQHIF